MAARNQGKTNFAVACSLLSQYIKEKGSVADIGIGMSPHPQDANKGKSQAFRPPNTIPLLPGADVESEMEGDCVSHLPQRPAATVPEDATREPERAQLTIFYGGKVMVFDNFPAEKAKDLLQLASKGNSTAQNFAYSSSSRDQKSALVPESANAFLAPQAHLPRTAQPSLSDLPIARKVSLQRFLEKKKDRINARAPYQVAASPEMITPVKQENSKSWLGLGPHFPASV